MLGWVPLAAVEYVLDLQKRSAARNPAYLTWVKGQPSVVSGRTPCDAHHPKGHGLGGTVKCSDYFAIPLTREEHDAFHAMGWQSWEELHGSQLEHAARTLERWISQRTTE